jgi:uncharacterized membrane protein YccF (DUF307 family)
MKTIGNIIWMLSGGLVLSVEWFLIGLLCCLTIVFIPWGIQCFKFARLAFWPFGKEIRFATGAVSFLANLLWIFLAGWEMALTCLMLGLVFCITIIGIPFGLQCFKFAKLALLPFGAEIV